MWCVHSHLWHIYDVINTTVWLYVTKKCSVQCQGIGIYEMVCIEKMTDNSSRSRGWARGLIAVWNQNRGEVRNREWRLGREIRTSSRDIGRGWAASLTLLREMGYQNEASTPGPRQPHTIQAVRNREWRLVREIRTSSTNIGRVWTASLALLREIVYQNEAKTPGPRLPQIIHSPMPIYSPT